MRGHRSQIRRAVFAFTFGLLLVSGSSRLVTAQNAHNEPKSDVQQALDRALDDERHAIAFYEAVITRFGERRPFTNIVRAERRHADALLQQYPRLGLKPPEDRWQAQPVAVPDTFAEACDAAENSEILNAALYDDIITKVSDSEVRAVFEQLRAASQERHLRTFRRHSNGWRAVTPDNLSDKQKAQQTLAERARDEVFKRLMSRLSTELAAGGPAGAISVCKEAAPEIAKDVGQRRSVRIGRTSWKLRNPRNVGPPWTKLLLHDQPETPRLAAARDGRLGVTLPIRVAKTCLACHGTAQGSSAPQPVVGAEDPQGRGSDAVADTAEQKT
jgi:rubrerythrin